MKRILPVVIAALVLVLFGLWARSDKAKAPSSPAKSSHSSGKQPVLPPKPTFDKQRYSTTDPASIWVIVNKQHPLNPLTYAPTDLVAVGNGQYMRAEAATALGSLLTAAKAAGYIVTPESGYRSYNTQVAVYASEVKAYGQAYADTESARPGYSEHQTGWAVDLGTNGCNIQDCFSNTSGGKWVIANAYRYGFILRYPPNLTDITGYRNEAWHFRYIGTYLSEEMHQQGIATLEQFFGVSGGTVYKD